jgi:hypothetical protein
MSCPKESIQQDPASYGPIGNHELIARGAYDPGHGNAKTGNIKSNVVPRKDLFNNAMSVWRMRSGEIGIEIEELVGILEERNDEKSTLFAVCAATAAQIRSIIAPDSKQRAFCVLDECECDPEDATKKHPAHAHIAICDNLRTRKFTEDCPTFAQIYKDLGHFIKNSSIWAKDT